MFFTVFDANLTCRGVLACRVFHLTGGLDHMYTDRMGGVDNVKEMMTKNCSVVRSQLVCKF